jgi:nicotinamidase-related amidase
MTGLLIVDAQNGLFDLIHDATAKLEAMRSLLEAARSSRIPVLFTQDVDVGEAASRTRKIHDSLEPRQNELVLEKGAADAFHGTRLEAVLRELGVNRLVICGLQTYACVFATTMGAVYRGFDVILAANAHGSSDTDELPSERVVAYHNEFLDGFGSKAHGFDAPHASVCVMPSSQIEFGRP